MLSINNFRLKIDDAELLEVSNLEINNREKHLILGNNNTGKSLFLKTIHGLNSNFEGEILIKEKPPIFYKRKKRTILIETSPHLLWEEDVWKNIILPLPKVTSRQKQKIKELCKTADLFDNLKTKPDKLSYSSQKFIELIRAVIQLPYLILLDDLDCYFDEINLSKALEICDFALNAGTSVLATSKTGLENFKNIYRIQSKVLKKL